MKKDEVQIKKNSQTFVSHTFIPQALIPRAGQGLLKLRSARDLPLFRTMPYRSRCSAHF